MEGKSELITVLIVDDHKLMRECIKIALQKVIDIQVVGEASSGEIAVEEVEKTNPQVILMDLKMPGIGGLEATRRILSHHPESKIIVLTSSEDESFPIWFQEAGAHSYLTKGCSMQKLIEAIYNVCRDEFTINSKLVNKLTKNELPKQTSLLKELTGRELQIMFMICSGAKVEEVCRKLFLSPKTINAYRYRLFDKLNVQNDVELTHLAIRHGILNRDVFSDEDFVLNGVKFNNPKDLQELPMDNPM